MMLALNATLRSQVQSVSGMQKQLKISGNSCPRQLLKLACTGLHLQCLIVWNDALHGKDEDGNKRDIDVAHSGP